MAARRILGAITSLELPHGKAAPYAADDDSGGVLSLGRRADRCAVIHHRRREGGEIETRLLAEGPIVLDPPGLHVAVEDFYVA